MADLVFNIAKGRVAELYIRVDTNDAANAALVIVPVDVAAVPWSRAYEIEGAAAPANAVCGGATAFNATARTADVRFECNATAER